MTEEVQPPAATEPGRTKSGRNQTPSLKVREILDGKADDGTERGKSKLATGVQLPLSGTRIFHAFQTFTFTRLTLISLYDL